MSFDAISAAVLGNVTIATTHERGATPEEIAERALNRIISIGADIPPVLRDQALAYREDIRKVLVFYMKEAVRSHNVTLVTKFRKAGHPELIPVLDT
tara:strand:+ start:1467 stop:1757 length:291 start_codon:yes stop_codon:yes gene_type:complete